MSSGTDWSDRMGRLAARAPHLDIFSDKLVLRDSAGWQITDSGRQLLSSLQAPVSGIPVLDKLAEPDAAATVQRPLQPVLRVVVDNTRTSKLDSGPDETRQSA